MTDSFTAWHRDAERARAREDAAASLEEAAKIVRESAGLVAAGHEVYLYAGEGTAGDRIAAVDAWAASHHVDAGTVAAVGYCARVFLGPVTVWAVALPVRELAGVAA